MKSRWPLIILVVAAFALGMACGDDDENEADEAGVGAECANADDCKQFCADEDEDGECDDPAEEVQCLNFKGGYCGIPNCMADDECPSGSGCVAHTDGNNYCFRFCVDKSDCNANRSADNEANCSSNVDYVSGDKGSKACVPPS